MCVYEPRWPYISHRFVSLLLHILDIDSHCYRELSHIHSFIVHDCWMRQRTDADQSLELLHTKNKIEDWCCNMWWKKSQAESKNIKKNIEMNICRQVFAFVSTHRTHGYNNPKWNKSTHLSPAEWHSRQPTRKMVCVSVCVCFCVFAIQFCSVLFMALLLYRIKSKVFFLFDFTTSSIVMYLFKLFWSLSASSTSFE